MQPAAPRPIESEAKDDESPAIAGEEVDESPAIVGVEVIDPNKTWINDANTKADQLL